MKKVKMLILCVVLLVAFSVNILAALPPVAEPMWDNTQNINSGFHFNGANSAACTDIIGKSGTTRIEATLKVYRLENSQWIYITENSASINSGRLYIETPFAADSGVYYKSIVVTHVTNSNGVTESLQRATIGIA